MTDPSLLTEALSPSASVLSRLALYCVTNFVLGFAAGLLVARFRRKSSEIASPDHSTQDPQASITETTPLTSAQPPTNDKSDLDQNQPDAKDAADKTSQNDLQNQGKPSTGADVTSEHNEQEENIHEDNDNEPNIERIGEETSSAQPTGEPQSGVDDAVPSQDNISPLPKTDVADANDDRVRVTRLTIYPIKACAGVQLSEARVTETGLENDRLFMVVDFTGRDLTQKKYPALALAKPTILDNGDIQLEAPDVRSVQFTPKTRGSKITVTAHAVKCEAIDQGDQAASFFASLLEIAGVRLVRMREGFVRPSRDGSFQTSFADVFPFLLVSDSSRRQVQEWADRSVDVRRFRSNILVDGKTFEPFEEDAWDTVRINDCKFNIARGCTRCTVVNVDPETAHPDDDDVNILNTLKTHRSFGNNVMFGQNMIPVIEKGVNTIIRVGDVVTVVERKDEIPKPDAAD